MNEFHTRSHPVVVGFILMRLFLKITLIVASYIIIDAVANLEKTILITIPHEIQIGLFAVITWILAAPLSFQMSEFISKKIIVNKQKIICHQGILIKQSFSIDKKIIKNVAVVQSDIAKRLGYGTVVITTEKTTPIENIKEPQLLINAIKSK